MHDETRMRELLGEILDSRATPEEACRSCPELLPEVRERWGRMCRVRDELDAMFPIPTGPAARTRESPRADAELPIVAGYEVEALLGRGGMGVVFRARHMRLNRVVALKMVLAGAYAGPSERERFQNEAEAVACLRHPNVVQIHDIGEANGQPYFTMEFVEGGTLAQGPSGTPRPSHSAAALVEILARAIDVAHRGGIIHRDLKPANILLTLDGVPKISDFGLARRLDGPAGLTRTGAAVGTPSYMSPEQARGDLKGVGPAADIYALGAVLYELLTGRPPFLAESASATLHEVLNRDPVAPSRLNSKVPRDLETVCLKCLRKDPGQRYPGASALAEDLNRFQRGEAIEARPEKGPQRLARWVRRRPVLAAAFAGLALLTATLVGGGLWLVSERAATERAADADLREMVRAQARSSWPEANAALERAKGRLGDRGSAALRRRLDRGVGELELVERLEAIRLNRARSVGGQVDFARTDVEYEVAFRGAGLGQVGDAPNAFAARVEASDIRGALVAAIDDWAAWTRDEGRRDWLLAVARMADIDRSAWRVRARDPATWKDGATLARVVGDAPVIDRSVSLFLALHARMANNGVDSVPFLKRVQQAHPGDFWVNYQLGRALYFRRDFGESARYYQAALALRPGSAFALNDLAMSLTYSGRAEEAVDLQRSALQIDPSASAVYGNLATTLQGLHRYDEAAENFRIALRFRPDVSFFHLGLSASLEPKGRQAEAVAEARKAVALDPRSAEAQRWLRAILLRHGKQEEARVAWEEALTSNPRDHAAWYGYAEWCLFLGREEEYSRARTSLLAAFGTSTDPFVAERTARACLLLPASDKELGRIVALGERAWGVDRSKYPAVYPHFLFVQGLAEYRRGRLDRAISIMQGEASRVLGPAPRLVLAMAQFRSGQEAESRTSLAAAILAHDWHTDRIRDQDGWIVHSLRREAEAIILRHPSAFHGGIDQLRDNDERFDMFEACQFAHRPGLMARPFAEAFASAPKRIDVLRSGHHDQAARATARVCYERGVHQAGLGEPERHRWREQALRCLRSDLAA